MKRFTVEANKKVWFVSDTMCEAFFCHKQAVILYFKNKENAEKIAEIMNQEWQDFVKSFE